MSARTIYITPYDMERLRKMLDEEKDRHRRGNGRGGEHLKDLEAELNRGSLLDPHEVPQDIITMNSQVHLVDLDTGEELICALVFPEDADVWQQKISVLAPIGTGMLGYRVGDVFEWPVPDGLRRLRVQRVLYQPEATQSVHV